MGKFLFWGTVFIGLLVVARMLARKAAGQGPRPSAFKFKAREGENGKTQAMVRCAHCGVHLPRSEATLIGGNTWCSEIHAKLGVPKST
jgi:uncharacterized protein